MTEEMNLLLLAELYFNFDIVWIYINLRMNYQSKRKPIDCSTKYFQINRTQTPKKFH